MFTEKLKQLISKFENVFKIKIRCELEWVNFALDIRSKTS